MERGESVCQSTSFNVTNATIPLSNWYCTLIGKMILSVPRAVREIYAAFCLHFRVAQAIQPENSALQHHQVVLHQAAFPEPLSLLRPCAVHDSRLNQTVYMKGEKR
jgi:hypothetical protein